LIKAIPAFDEDDEARAGGDDIPAQLGGLRRPGRRAGHHRRPAARDQDLVAGRFTIDVESRERAVELASYVSSEPGPAGAAPNRVQIALPVHDAME
jgi:hypothetical protein